MNASVAIQVLPQQVDQEKMLRCVDAVISYIASCEVRYTVGPFETVLLGEGGGIAHVPQIDELGTLDDLSVLDVEAGDDPLG